MAKAKDKEYYDKGRTNNWEPDVGDKVWLSHEHIQSDRPSIKLAHKRLGPFEVAEKIGTGAYRLKIPKSMQIHPVFHTSRLALVKDDSIPGRKPKPVPPVNVKGDVHYEIEKILNSRIYRRQLQYLVRWKGHDPSADSWEPAEEMSSARRVVNEFHRHHPEAPTLKGG
ncbi:hypothetical protein FRC12_018602 [Ceratobasidium sp. 428]|nr:hypothetical protein FRC12_018602 [Ceratobasidium sp. 428]